MREGPMDIEVNGWRNRTAQAIANFALDHIATSLYRDVIDGSIRLGMRAATWGDPDLVERYARSVAIVEKLDDGAGLPDDEKYVTVPVMDNHDWANPVGRLEIRKDMARRLCQENAGLFAGWKDDLELMEMSVEAIPARQRSPHELRDDLERIHKKVRR